ncbi:MAG TPA: SGNH/GDSL hydrolase family protein [bacterium]|nr:SGNH/GDSL hydrolase family protein [bacterium]HOL49073.1 SGNH/GDSL hydrolase family protein [bacterium]HPO52093.1 SGNH/GDSL hydrolase family protein [bacterium]HXK44521.1 SGNH/GDSL hydrolase family protein [bacterium]
MGKNFLQIVLFGDSMTWSPGVAIGKRYADFIQEKLQNICGDNYIVDVAACGDGGNTAEEAYARIERDCISYQPHIVVISLGANDCIRAPDRETFKSYYRKIVNEVKHDATRHIILETIPALDEELHSQRNNPKALFYGGLEKYVEFFSHSFIREMAKTGDFLLYDRFTLYHQMLAENPQLREKLILKDGVHLTEQGNEFFAENLVPIIQPLIPDIHQFQTNAEQYLEQALLNPVYIECTQSLKNGNLKEYLTEHPNLKRLMLEKTKSTSRRAIAYTEDEKVKNEATIVQYLTSGFLAAEKIFNSQDSEIIGKSKQWAISHLAKLSNNRVAKTLVELMNETCL